MQPCTVSDVGSICPKSWTLPKSAGNQSFTNLLSTYAITTDTAALKVKPLYFISGGYTDPSVSGLYHIGNFGFYWANTTYSGGDGYALRFPSTDSITPQHRENKYNGAPVHCLAR